FLPEFWGEGGIEQIHAEAGGWPHLVQLIAETVIDLLNSSSRSQVDTQLLEQSLNRAVESGNIALTLLMKDECRLPGEWDYLRAFRTRMLQPPPSDEAVAHSLLRRLLVKECNNSWQLRVPLMQRWLRSKIEY